MSAVIIAVGRNADGGSGASTVSPQANEDPTSFECVNPQVRAALPRQTDSLGSGRVTSNVLAPPSAVTGANGDDATKKSGVDGGGEPGRCAGVRLWVKAFMAMMMQALLPLLSIATDLVASIKIMRVSNCVRNTLDGIASDDQATAQLFLNAIGGTAWASTVVGVLCSAFLIHATVMYMRQSGATWAGYHDQTVKLLTRHGCNKYKLVRLICVVFEDVPQVVCNLLMAIFLRGFTTSSSFKVAISVLLLSRAFARIATFVWPWAMSDKCCRPGVASAFRWVVFGGFFCASCTLTLYPVWTNIALFTTMATAARSAMYRSDLSTPPLSALGDAYSGLTEARSLQYAWKVQACLGATCTPMWDSHYRGSVMYGTLPWDVLSYQVLRKDPTEWDVYGSGTPRAPAAAPSDTFIIQFRLRSQTLFVTLVEASTGSEGLSFLPQPMRVPGADPQHGDMLHPVDAQRRTSFSLTLCEGQKQNSECWSNFTVPDTALSHVQLSSLSGLAVNLHVLNNGVCDTD